MAEGEHFRQHESGSGGDIRRGMLRGYTVYTTHHLDPNPEGFYVCTYVADGSVFEMSWLFDGVPNSGYTSRVATSALSV